jgi:two-component system LytT family response regulator
VLKHSKGLEVVNYNDIFFIKADGSYSLIKLQNKEILYSKNLSQMEQLVPSFFLRVHKSYLVNKNYIETFSKFNKSITLTNKISIPIAKRKMSFYKFLFQ